VDIIELIPRMSVLLNEFIVEYVNKSINVKNKLDLDPTEANRIHFNTINRYTIKVIKLAMHHVKDETIEIEFNEWMVKHGAEVIKGVNDVER